MLSAMKVAAIWPPSAPPSVRITVFMPLATPVWVRGTAWTIRLPSAANASPIPIPSSAAVINISYGWRWASPAYANDNPVTAAPDDERALRTETARDGPGGGAEQPHQQRGRQQ